MRKIILISIIVALIALTGCTEQKLSAEIDVIPDISIGECLAQIKATNPEMPGQAASDNCYTLEAVNKGDKGLCEQVSEGFRPNCLAQFG